jgi:hypothetical protein
LTAALLFAACGGGESSKVVVDEHDGAELVALMEGVKEAIKTKNQAKFASLFTTATASRSPWSGLMKWKQKEGEYLILQVTSGPKIERATANVHVNKLILHTWHELPTEYENITAVYHTKWTFAHADDGWKISALRVSSSAGNYGDLLRDFNRMDHFNFNALEMDWEEHVDPSPVVARALLAIGAGDLDRLKSCTLDGALFRAYEKRIELPTIANGPHGSGRHNRENSAKFLDAQIRDFDRASGMLAMGVEELVPLVNAYRITSMPRNCKKVRLLIDFNKEGSDTDVTGFTVSWTAAYIMQKWLAEVVCVETIRSWG